jgi:hypothetical protein
MNQVGKSGSRVLFTDNNNGVIVDLDDNVVVESGSVSALTASASWETFSLDEDSSAYELAEAALTTLDVAIIAAGSRLYTIPKAAQAEAKKALEWRKEHKRGGTPVGVNTARTLAKGGQIGIEKVRHIAKYFPRHEIDKKAKGYEPGELGFPSRGRIAWALWGGDAAWRWAQAIVEQENKKALRADGYALPGYEDDEFNFVVDNNYDADLDLFNSDNVEFIARMRMDGSGIDRLYVINEDLSVAVWDAGHWHTLSDTDQDLTSYDLALDEFNDNVEFSHVEIDPESALFISACFQENPNEPVSLFDVNYEEAELILRAADELDLEFLDKTLLAVGAPTDQAPKGDGVYTPEERSEKAQKQVRDKTGKFAKQGGRVVVAGDTTKRGNIVAINPQKSSVTIKLDSTGKTVEIPANLTQPEDEVAPGVQSAQLPEILGLDTTGILGQPRTPIDRPYAQIPGTLPRMNQEDIAKMQGDWPAWVKQQRDSFASGQSTATPRSSIITGPDQTQKYDKPDFIKELEELTGVRMITDPYKHPMLEAFLNKKVKGADGKVYYPNKLYYQPAVPRVAPSLTAAASENKAMTPETSDVQPLFFAIVSEDDTSAVIDLVSLVPAATDSTSSMTYTRENKQWVRNEAILVDMNSATPPPVVPLDAVALKSVIEQIDGVTSVAASVNPDEKFITVLWGKGGNVMFLASPDEEALTAAGIIVAEEQELADALIEITQKYGKFNEDDSGVWAGYESAEENENKEIGVTCANCMLYAGGDVCKIIEQPVEPLGYCRFALIPDGVVKQEPMQAAGGADRNRGNAERLRRYWTIGKGGLKIRWATPGDWTRCYRNLKKYMGPRAKGYCSLRHKEMTGMWPGDKRNPGMRKGALAMDDILTSEQIIDAAALSARANEARNRVVTAGAEIEYADGGKFSIPLVIPEELESGDGRKFKKGAIEIRELPLPLLWQIKTAEGHNGSVVVGRIDYMERIESDMGNGIGNATGVFDQGEYGQEAERLVRNGFIRGVSADLDQFEASQETDLTDSEQEDSGKIGTDKLVISHARVMAVTLVPKPAFQECQIYLVDDEKQEDTMIPDGTYVDEMDETEASALVACGLVAGSIPVVPPSTWFENPKLNKATPLTVDDEGRVFGHIAAWHVDHIGMSFGTKPPRSRSKYAYFHTGVVRTDGGKDVPVGQLTLAGGHASLEASAAEAVRHYDDTASAIADVHAGEDAFGIWVAGALRPGTTPEQVRALRASAPSGDWRPVKGHLELVAVCQVNVPGFPIARARVASGAVMALVAAGAGVLARMKSDPVAELSARVQKLEQLENAELSTKAEAAIEKFNVVREQKAAQLSAGADAAYARIHGEPKYDDEFGYISREKRQALAKKGYALPDGSYPITNVDSLKDSIQAYGRSKPGKRAAVRRHIMKRARALDKADLIPDKWKKASASLIDEDLTDIRARLAEFSSKIENTGEELGKALAVEVQDQGKYTPETQPRDEKGKFRVVLARLKSDLGDSGSDEAIKKIEEVENLDDAGNYLEATRSAGDLISIVDRIDTGALDSKSLENVRSSARALGEVIANLPLPFGSDTEKVRYSDLPPALKGLIDDMISRVEDKIGKKDADEATVDLKSFMSGGDYYSQAEISSQMSRLLRLLT